MAGEIAAVHRRDVERAHRRQRVGLVPVVEMALIFLHLLQRGERRIEAGQRLGEADPAEIARGDDREQIDADIRRRGAPREDRGRVFLEIVRRQVMVFLVGEFGEITPCAPRVTAQRRLVGGKDFKRVLRLGRAADQPCDQRRGEPDHREGRGDESRGAGHRKRHEERQAGNGHGRPHQLEIIGGRIGRRLGLRGGAPFQKVAARDEQAIERAHDGIGHEIGRIGDEGGAQRHVRRGERHFGQHGLRVPLQRIVHVARNDVGDDAEGRRHEHGEDEEYLPDGGGAERQHAPADDCRDHPQDRVERAAQIVHHLPARHGADAAAGGEEPGQKLPVATRPAMVARHVDIIAGRIILDHLHVADQSAARIAAFEQVMAEDGVFRDTVLQRRLEGVDVVKPLAGESAFSQQILIGIGHGEDIRVDAAIDREDALEERRLVTGGERGRDARLQNAVAAHDLAGFLVDDRAVQRMAELACEVRHRFGRQPRIGVERHDIANIPGQTLVGGEEGRVLIAPQKQVQLVQLAALALPAHPAALLLVIEAAAVQQEEARLVVARIMLVEPVDLLARIVVDFHVGGRDFLLRVGPVADQREIDLTARIGEVVHLQVADLLVDGIARGDEGRHGDQRARLRRQPVLVFEADQPRRLHEPRHQRVEQRIGGVHGREYGQKREQGAQLRRQADAHHAVMDDPQDDDGEDRGGNEQTPEAQPPVEAQRPHAGRRAIAADLFQFRAALAGKIIGDGALALGFRMAPPSPIPRSRRW